MKKILILILAISGLSITPNEPLVSTFSIVAVDLETGDLGVAVQSKFPNVRALVPWLEAGVGAVASQSFVEVDYGIKGLELMKNGATAEEAMAIVAKGDPGREDRQVGMVDMNGNAATWTGANCFDWAGGYIGDGSGGTTKVGSDYNNRGMVISGKGFAAQGNILVSEETVQAMAKAFQDSEGQPLAQRLLDALVAGGEAGGDQRGEQSAALVVVKEGAGYDGTDNYIDLSVYDHKTPIAELVRLYDLNNLYFTEGADKEKVKIDEALAKEFQEMWTTRGFYKGDIDGIVDADFKKMLTDYMGWENYDMRIAAVEAVDIAAGEDIYLDEAVLADIRSVFSEGRWLPKRN